MLWDIFSFIILFGLVYLITTIIFLVAWVIYCLQGNPAIVGVCWAVSLVTLASLFTVWGGDHYFYQYAFFVAVLIWGGAVSYSSAARTNSP